MRALPIFVSAAVLLALALAAARAGPETPEARGRALFHDTRGLEVSSCAHCHAVVPDAEERKVARHLGPGFPLYGVAIREGWWGRRTYADVGAALQHCAKRWQERKGGFKAAARADLVAYLKTLVPKEPAKLPARKIKRPKLLTVLSGGDKKRGAALAQRHCAGCHHDGEEALSFALRPHKRRAADIARKVRGYDRKGRFKPKGAMAYFPTERLSDEDLRHILAWHGR